MVTHMVTAPIGRATPSSGATQHKTARGFVSQIGQVVDSVARFFESLQASQQAAAHYAHLAHLSNEELSARGLKRQDIPHYVVKRMLDRH